MFLFAATIRRLVNVQGIKARVGGVRVIGAITTAIAMHEAFKLLVMHTEAWQPCHGRLSRKKRDHQQEQKLHDPVISTALHHSFAGYQPTRVASSTSHRISQDETSDDIVL